MISHGVSPAFQNVCHCPRGLNTPCAWLGCDDVVTQQRPEGAGQHIGMLVFAVVTMQGRSQRAGRQLVMNYREAAAGLRTIDLPLCAEAASVEFLTNLKRDQQWTGWKRRST